jgi:FixJ family two-component response regulator
LTDVIMPGGSGRTLGDWVAEHRPDTRVIYMSGYTDDAIAHHGVLEPGIHFIQKPFSPEELVHKVREALS